MKTYGIEKTTVRFTVKLPDCTARVQWLYDYGAWFSLHEETFDNAADTLEFMEALVQKGAKRIDRNTFIDDDDLQEKQTFTYELIT